MPETTPTQHPRTPTSRRSAVRRTVRLHTFTPDVAVELALTMTVQARGQTPEVQEAANRVVKHFQELNNEYPPITREGNFLDRIELIAASVAHEMILAEDEMEEEVQSAIAAYENSSLDEIKRGVMYGALMGLARLVLIAGASLFFAKLAIGLGGFDHPTAEKMTYLPLAIAFAVPLGSNIVRYLVKVSFGNKLVRQRDEKIHVARAKWHEKRRALVEYATESGKNAWMDYTRSTAEDLASLPPNPGRLLIEALAKADAMHQDTPAPLFKVLTASCYTWWITLRRLMGRPKETPPQAAERLSLADTVRQATQEWGSWLRRWEHTKFPDEPSGSVDVTDRATSEEAASHDGSC